MTASNLKRFALPTALVVGGVTAGSFLAPIGLASAQEGDSDTDATESDATGSDSADDGAETEATEREGRRRGHRGHFAAKAEVLEETLGLSAEEIRAGLADDKSLADLADEQGVSVDDLTAALVEAASERIDEAVAEGKIDAEEAEAKKAELADRIAEMVTSAPSERTGDGHRHAHRHAHPHRGKAGLRGASEAVQEALGLTAEEIQAGLADGKSLADLADEQGVSIDDLADALVAEATGRIDEAVEEGKIDEDRAAEAKERLEEMIDRAIEAEPFELGRGVGRAEGRRGHHRGGLRGGDADAGEVTDTGVVETSLVTA